MKQLEASDFVFAYIDSWSCFGTLCEIGYAHAKRIPVVIYFASKELQEDMWFAAECADIVFRSSGHISHAKDKRFIPVASKIVGRIYSEDEDD
jgi:nucleoside 2-deoxyribosyltransferase